MKFCEKEKGVAMKEYDSLRSANESLKALITNIMKVEVEETQEVLKLSDTEIPTSPSTNCPVYVYNQPSLLPLIWPAIIPPSNVVQLQCVPQNGIAIPSQVPVLTSDEPYSSPEQGNLIRINVSGTPFYVLPCPWLFPLSHHANGIHPQSFDLPDKQNEVLLNNQSRASSSTKTIAHIENHHGFPSMKMRSEASNSAEPVPANNLHKNPFSLLPDGDGQHLGPQSRGVLMPAPLSHVRPAVTVEHENISWPKLSCQLVGTSAAPGYDAKGIPETNQEPVVCPSKKQMDADAAAEARKRRKEITNLKNLQYRQFRMP